MKLKELLFSTCCINCGIAVSDKEKPLCPECEYIMNSKKLLHSKSIIAPVSYHSNPCKSLIYFMKDFNDPYVFDYVAEQIEAKIKKCDFYDEISEFYITYAPRNPIKLIKKRYDQSKEIADFLATRLFEDDKGKVIKLFSRKIFSKEQKTLSLLERVNNAKKVFSIRKKAIIPKKLIIVDDVISTGSTILTLKDIAMEAGVEECIICSFALNDKR